MSVVKVGDVIGGRYLHESVLGQGGMAVVYKANHKETLQSCAVKLILPPRGGVVHPRRLSPRWVRWAVQAMACSVRTTRNHGKR
jgi:hypothetical protein